MVFVLDVRIYSLRFVPVFLLTLPHWKYTVLINQFGNKLEEMLMFVDKRLSDKRYDHINTFLQYIS